MFCNAQKKVDKKSFLRNKTNSLIKSFGESIYKENVSENPVMAVNHFIAFKGKTIRSISIAPTGFNKIVEDSIIVNKNRFSKIADFFHKKTLPAVIRKNLFFKEGDKILPLLLSDNERYLRTLSFLQDALIVVDSDSASLFADIIIVTKDVFSLGGSFRISNTNSAQVALRDDNLFGTGNTFEYTSLYDLKRSPRFGTGAFFTQRNIKNSFINWSVGFKTFTPAFNSGRLEEEWIASSRTLTPVLIPVYPIAE